jgi:hypothetical protein
VPARDVADLYIRWIGARAALHRGWWLVTGLYLVVKADFDALQLVAIGTAQGLTGLLFEIPEYSGEIGLGFSLGLLAQATSIATALTAGCALLAGAALLVLRGARALAEPTRRR